MYSVGKSASARTTLWFVVKRTGVRWNSDFKLSENSLDADTSSQASERHLTIAEREALQRRQKKDAREALRQRLMGVKKEVVVDTGKKIDKKAFENLMLPIVQKHLEEKRRAKLTDTNIINPIPQTYTEDEREFLRNMTPTEAENLQQEKGENDDDFWERRSLAQLPKYDWLTPDLSRSRKPGRNYTELARKLQLETFGDPNGVKNYMRYPDQPKQLFVDERKSLLEPTKLEDVKEHEMVLRLKENRDGRDYANNIQKMYNRVQKFKSQRSLEMEAMGVKVPAPPVANSKFTGKYHISAAVILERQWDKLSESINKKKPQGGGMGAMKSGRDGNVPKEESGKKKRSKSDQEASSDDELVRLKVGPPDWGLPNIRPPELTPEEALEQKKADERKMQPYNEWVEYWKNWKAAPRETEDDLSDNRKSINRALHKKLYLIVKRKSDGLWLFPSALNKEDESIRQTAERSLATSIGKGLTTYFHSNAPVGFYNSYFTTAQEQDKQQAESDKIFYMRARYFRGTPDPMRRAGLDDYLWVTREQLSEYLPKDYHDRVINFIWPDPN